MKKIIFLAATSALCALPANANEESRKGFYVPLTAGYNQVKQLHGVGGSAFNVGKIRDDFGAGVTFETGIGYDFGNIRTELVYNLVDTTVEKAYNDLLGNSDSARGDLTLHAVTVGAYYDFESNSKFTPYFGGSIGGGKVTINNLREVWDNGNDISEDSGTSVNGVLFFTAKVGTSYDLNEKIDLFGEVSYYGTEEFVYNTNDYHGLSAFGVNIGARYKF